MSQAQLTFDVSAIGKTLHRRIRLRFSLRALLIVVTAVAIVGGSSVCNIKRFRSQRISIDKLSARCGRFFIKPAFPFILMWLLGDRECRTLVDVVRADLSSGRSGSSQRFNDEDLEHIGELHKLQVLSISQAAVTDHGMRHLAGLRRLKQLAITDSRISDAGLRHIGELTKLDSLVLDRTQVTDDGLAHLAGLKTLAVLSLNETLVEGTGLRYVKKSPLELLRMNGCPLTDAGVEEIYRFPKLARQRTSSGMVTE